MVGNVNKGRQFFHLATEEFKFRPLICVGKFMVARVRFLFYLLKDLVSLDLLNLQDNQLCTLSSSVFDPVEHPVMINTFRIYENPLLRCDRHLCWLKQAQWVNVIDASTTYCAEPPTLAGKSWAQLTEDDLHCTRPGENDVKPLLYKSAHREGIYSLKTMPGFKSNTLNFLHF